MTIQQEEPSWEKVFRKFYNDNEQGGSSRWLVAPNIVELFIRSQRKQVIEEIQKYLDDLVTCDNQKHNKALLRLLNYALKKV